MAVIRLAVTASSRARAQGTSTIVLVTSMAAFYSRGSAACSRYTTDVLTAIWRQFVMSVRLQLRNPAALAYSYLVPLVFLGAFWTLYRHESPPLGRHLGQLLTITALSGACFAVPAWLVGDRQRGVWRHYRLAPMPGVFHLAAMIGASYLLLLSAGTLQVAAAAAIGTPLPSHPFHLWLAFTAACAAFLGIGLLITMLGDTVPAAQALGQAVFLPMLILGGIAVPLDRLPDWAQGFAAALPGRYAVDAIDGALSGRGLARLAPDAAALAIMTAVSMLASMVIFRWEAGHRIGLRRAVGTAGFAVAGWIAAGAVVNVNAGRDAAPVAAPTESASAVAPRAGDVAAPPVDGREAIEKPSPAGSPRANPAPAVSAAAPAAAPRSWPDVTMDDLDVGRLFADLPPDDGVVTPINAEYRRRDDVECIRSALRTWPPGDVDDVVQRARNVLLPAAVADLLHLEIERDVPHVVFDHLRQALPKDQLIKVAYWVGTHPGEGDLYALADLAGVCLDVRAPDDAEAIRERIGIYAMKLLGRLTGKIK